MPAKSAKTGSQIFPIYVIAGKDKFLLASYYDKLLDELLPPEQRGMSLYEPAADKANITEVLDELRTLPFLAERRVVVIKDADDFISEYRQSLEKYFENPSPSGTLVMTVGTWNKSTKLAKKLPKTGKLIVVTEIKPAHLPRYVAEYARSKHNKGINRSAAEMLIELAGDSPGRLCSEIDKLAVYVAENKSISVQDVEKLIGHNRMFGAFNVIDAATAGDLSIAIDRLRNMFAADRSAEYTVVGAFAYHFRRMFTARGLLDRGVSTRQIKSQMNIWHNPEGFFGQLRKLPIGTIASVITELARIDYAIKTGGSSAKIAIERLLIQLGSGSTGAVRRFG